ncbi:Acetylglutamate kinase [Emticicia aquatica]|uniref:Acetylglutamate kinase n=1 Tax=Emticicia aquatica TaxID=1681835 RepID=A0ABM9ARI3_9BACT|nr:acetylglutamate kinase [Emticicia aquatica]CAH0996549.1 Acetylglutamate kinase [Emticicia aquatica]
MNQKLNIIKIGGNVIDNPRSCKQFLEDFSALNSAKILIHGGGKIATKIAVKLDVETKMVDGRRITDLPMLEVVTMVYGGLVNKQIVAQLQALGCNAIGLTGADGGVILAKKRAVKDIDYGFVGDVEKVDNKLIDTFLQNNLTPIFAPLTFDKEGNMLNTNADTQASSVAVAMAGDYEVNLIYCFEKKGVLSNPDDNDSVIPQLTPALYAEYKASGVINAGMIPKLDNAFSALQKGVSKVIICHADELKQAVAEGTRGTQIISQ